MAGPAGPLGIGLPPGAVHPRRLPRAAVRRRQGRPRDSAGVAAPAAAVRSARRCARSSLRRPPDLCVHGGSDGAQLPASPPTTTPTSRWTMWWWSTSARPAQRNAGASASIARAISRRCANGAKPCERRGTDPRCGCWSRLRDRRTLDRPCGGARTCPRRGLAQRAHHRGRADGDGALRRRARPTGHGGLRRLAPPRRDRPLVGHRDHGGHGPAVHVGARGRTRRRPGRGDATAAL